MTTPDVYTETFATFKMKPEHLINDLGYLYADYKSCIFVTRRNKS